MFLMWFDDSDAPLTEKIAAGSAAYRARFGVDPTLVLVREPTEATYPRVQIRARATVPPHMLWLGQAEAGTADAGVSGEGK